MLSPKMTAFLRNVLNPTLLDLEHPHEKEPDKFGKYNTSWPPREWGAENKALCMAAAKSRNYMVYMYNDDAMEPFAVEEDATARWGHRVVHRRTPTSPGRQPWNCAYVPETVIELKFDAAQMCLVDILRQENKLPMEPVTDAHVEAYRAMEMDAHQQMMRYEPEPCYR